MNNIDFRKLWIDFRGDAKEFSLEARIFHAVCGLSVVIILISIILNLISGMNGNALLMFMLALVIAVLFYLSRLKQKLFLSIILFNVIGNLLLAVNFYFNSGINGPSLIIFLLGSFLTIAIVSRKQYVIWLGLNIGIVLSLLAVSFHHPELFKNSYPTDLSRYVDLAYSYVLVALLIFLVTDYIRVSYHKEKKLTDHKARELLLSNETKDKLLSILAHDLRAPLISIQNYLELLSEFDLGEDEKQSINAMLLSETHNTQQMLSNLLSWSKTQMEGVKAKLSYLNLKETLAATLSFQTAMAAKKNIALKDNIGSEIYVMADGDMLQLVIRNLLNNAIKFTPEGGTISLDTKKEGTNCVIMVKDNGNGISEESQQSLFSLKARPTFGTRNEKGFGLGLVLSKEFSEIQNGELWFESIPGTGTTFFLSLPDHST